ncbi:MAG: beta-lactamase family protein [Alphaproteobacteria bacterium]|nr:beta-lactamase family protein [Alphaproteobacteria bacterium]
MFFFSNTTGNAIKAVGVLALLSLNIMGAAHAAEKAESLSIDVDALLEQNKLPGLSVAVVDDYELVYEQAFGVKEYGKPEAVDRHTAFSAASISKAVTGLLAVMLAEEGALDLDAPVSQYLKRWQLPENGFTKNTPITLGHLLTHTAGTSQSGFADFFEGDDVPTLVESLNGIKLPRHKEPIKVMWEPGTRFQYSGGGYVIAQVAIEDETGKSLAALAEEMIFTPLGMKDTTMYQYGHPKFLKNVAKAHKLDRTLEGPGGVAVYPQTAASGLWTTPGDMAKLVLEIQKALAGRKTSVISKRVAVASTRVQTLKKAGGWSLGWMRYYAEGNLDWFAHSGYNSGIGGQVMATMQDGRAILVFGNGVHRSRVPSINAVVADVIKSRGWGQALPEATEQPSDALLQSMVGWYENLNQGFFSPFGRKVMIYQKDGQLLLDNSGGKYPPRKMVYNGNGRFVLDQFVNAQVGLSQTSEGSFLTFFRDGLEAYALKKVDPDLATGE